MSNDKLNRIIAQIAKAKWDAIPKQGAVLTLEEFIEYAAKQIRQ